MNASCMLLPDGGFPSCVRTEEKNLSGSVLAQLGHRCCDRVAQVEPIPFPCEVGAFDSPRLGPGVLGRQKWAVARNLGPLGSGGCFRLFQRNLGLLRMELGRIEPSNNPRLLKPRSAPRVASSSAPRIRGTAPKPSVATLAQRCKAGYGATRPVVGVAVKGCTEECLNYTA